MDENTQDESQETAHSEAAETETAQTEAELAAAEMGVTDDAAQADDTVTIVEDEEDLTDDEHPDITQHFAGVVDASGMPDIASMPNIIGKFHVWRFRKMNPKEREVVSGPLDKEEADQWRDKLESEYRKNSANKPGMGFEVVEFK